jgi:hypothetical protein
MQLSVNGVVVTCNPSKVELRVRFPLNANFFVFCAHIQYVVTSVPGGKTCLFESHCVHIGNH